MLDLDVNGVVLRVNSKTLGDIGEKTVLGKTLAEWVGNAIGVSYTVAEGSQVINLADTFKRTLDRTKQVTVALYCDTPLVTPATIAAAVEAVRSGSSNVMRLPRGFVFKTEYLFSTDSLYLQAVPADREFDTVTDGESLSRITDVLRRRILRYHAANGVNIPDFSNVYINSDVVIERGATIEPYNFIKGRTLIKSGALIKPGNYIENCIISNDAKVDSSRLYDSSVGAGTTVGPFAYLRPNSVVGEGCRIGDFVELKNCIIGNGTKVSHLSYVGDAELGAECNVGCGVVFVNYDGKNKHKSIVGRRVFIGSNSNIIAPVTISDGSFIAAGSTVTDSVPAHALAIARSRQTIKPNWQGNLYAPPIINVGDGDGDNR